MGGSVLVWVVVMVLTQTLVMTGETASVEVSRRTRQGSLNMTNVSPLFSAVWLSHYGLPFFGGVVSGYMKKILMLLGRKGETSRK
jgi:hypothetical protein